MATPDWLTVVEVAKLLDLAPKTVYLLSGKSTTSARRLPSHRLGPRGGKLRFLRADVDAYIASMKTVHDPIKPKKGEFRFFGPTATHPKPRP